MTLLKNSRLAGGRPRIALAGSNGSRLRGDYVLRLTDNQSVRLSTPVEKPVSEIEYLSGMSDHHSISMAGDIRRLSALGHLPDPRNRRGADDELLVAATQVRAIDAWGGAVICALVDDHLYRAGEGTACVWPPSEEPAVSRLHDLLGTLPPRASFPHDARTPPRDRSVVIPAQRVYDQDEADALALWVLATAFHTRPRLSRPEAKLLSTAAPALAGNGL